MTLPGSGQGTGPDRDKMVAALFANDDAESDRLLAEIAAEMRRGQEPDRPPAEPQAVLDLSRVSDERDDAPTYSDADISEPEPTLPTDDYSMPSSPGDAYDDDAGDVPDDPPEAALAAPSADDWDSGIRPVSQRPAMPGGIRWSDDDSDLMGKSGVVDKLRDTVAGLKGGVGSVDKKTKLTAAAVAAVIGVGIIVSRMGGGDGIENNQLPPPVAEAPPSQHPESKTPDIEVLNPSGKPPLISICAPPVVDPSFAFDTRKRTAWTCPIIHSMAGVLEINYANPVEVMEIALIPGWPKTDENQRNRWLENMVVTQISWRFDGREKIQSIPNPTPQGVVFNVRNKDGSGMVASKIVMQIQRWVSPVDLIRKDPSGAARAGIIPNTAEGLNLDADLPVPENATAITGLQIRGVQR